MLIFLGTSSSSRCLLMPQLRLEGRTRERRKHLCSLRNSFRSNTDSNLLRLQQLDVDSHLSSPRLANRSSGSQRQHSTDVHKMLGTSPVVRHTEKSNSKGSSAEMRAQQKSS